MSKPRADCLWCLVQVQSCKRNMNTFAFVGDLDKSPEVSCVYHSEDAENAFLKDPKTARLGDGYRARPGFESSSEPSPAATKEASSLHALLLCFHASIRHVLEACPRIHCCYASFADSCSAWFYVCPHNLPFHAFSSVIPSFPLLYSPVLHFTHMSVAI